MKIRPGITRLLARKAKFFFSWLHTLFLRDEERVSTTDLFSKPFPARHPLKSYVFPLFPGTVTKAHPQVSPRMFLPAPTFPSRYFVILLRREVLSRLGVGPTG